MIYHAINLKNKSPTGSPTYKTKCLLLNCDERFRKTLISDPSEFYDNEKYIFPV